MNKTKAYSFVLYFSLLLVASLGLMKTDMAIYGISQEYNMPTKLMIITILGLVLIPCVKFITASNESEGSI